MTRILSALFFAFAAGLVVATIVLPLGRAF